MSTYTLGNIYEEILDKCDEVIGEIAVTNERLNEITETLLRK